MRQHVFSLARYAALAFFPAVLLNLPPTLTPSWTDGPSLGAPRDGAAPVLLGDGRVLVHGGQSGGSLTATAELLVGDRSFVPAASMNFARCRHAAVALPDG